MSISSWTKVLTFEARDDEQRKETDDPGTKDLKDASEQFASALRHLVSIRQPETPA
jgi:hypothetical protein